MNPFGLHFDGDLRRIYEVPADSSFTVDSEGYRVYVPDDIPSADELSVISTAELWSRFVDFDDENLWTTIALDKSGGALRYIDSESGAYVYANFDLRLINSWQIVLANYPHQFQIEGNLYGDLGLDSTFDNQTITSVGVVPSVNFSDAGQIVQGATATGSGLTAIQAAQLEQIVSNQNRMFKVYGMTPGATFKMPPASGGDVVEDGEVIATVSGDCTEGFTVEGVAE